MEVIVRQEAGYSLALYGFSLSYKDRSIRPEDWWCCLTQSSCPVCGDHVSFYKEDDKYCTYYQSCDKCSLGKKVKQIEKAALLRVDLDKGHNKFLRQIKLWLDIEAPRYWWSEFDTYKVGTTAQSESTIHTLTRRDIDNSDFQDMEVSPKQLKIINKYRTTKDALLICKKYLPEGYLQRRLVTLNYAVLRNIILQRKTHRLPEWHYFIREIYSRVNHPELLPKLDD